MPHSILLLFLLLPSFVFCLSLPAKDKDVVETIAPIDDILANPFIGFVTDATTLYPTPKIPQTLAYTSITWADLEPDERGKIDFVRLEKGWAEQVKLGRRIGFRLKCVDPYSGKGTDIPQWLVAKAIDMRDYDLDGAKGKMPDWNNTTFLDEHDRLLKELGKRYNLDPRVAWIDVGSYGFWGEWQLYKNEKLGATDDTKRHIIDAYFYYFPDKRKLIPFSDNFGLSYASARGVGVRNDYLGSDEENKIYADAVGRIDADFSATQYTFSPIAGAFGGNEETAHATVTDRCDANLDFLQKTHWSFIGPVGGSLLMSEGKTLENAKAIYQKLGYRLRFSEFRHPEQVRIGETLTVHVTQVNDGCAPFYYPWPVSIRMTSTDTPFTHTMHPTDPFWDVRAWLPGARKLDLEIFYTRSDKFVPGTYTVSVAILDPATQLPGVNLAQKGRDADGYYPLGTIKVVK